MRVTVRAGRALAGRSFTLQARVKPLVGGTSDVENMRFSSLRFGDNEKDEDAFDTVLELSVPASVEEAWEAGKRPALGELSVTQFIWHLETVRSKAKEGFLFFIRFYFHFFLLKNYDEPEIEKEFRSEPFFIFEDASDANGLNLREGGGGADGDGSGSGASLGGDAILIGAGVGLAVCFLCTAAATCALFLIYKRKVSALGGGGGGALHKRDSFVSRRRSYNASRSVSRKQMNPVRY